MAHRLLPFRQYDENDVINLFALNADSVSGGGLKVISPNTDDINADGVLVEVSEGDMVLNDTVNVSEDSRFMASYNSPVGRNPYPTNPLKVSTPAASGNKALGVTLRQTLAVDENGESLLFNPVKKDELQAVLSGQTVPVLSKGIIAVHENAIEASSPVAVGSELSASQNGKFAVKAASDASVGICIGTGARGSNKDDNYAGVRQDSLSGAYYVIKLDC